MKLRSLLALLVLVVAAACHSSPTAPDDRTSTPSFEDEVPAGGGWAGTGG